MKLLKGRRAKPWLCLWACAGVIVLIAVCYALSVCLGREQPFDYSEPQRSLTENFGVLFGIEQSVDVGEFSAETGLRPDENMEIPFDQTKLSRAFNMLDKRHLYISGKSFSLSSTGYIKVERVYAVRDDRIYIMLDNGVEDYHLLSDGKRVVGLDFEKSTYTVTSPLPYSIDELLFTDGYSYCTYMGTDAFMGEQKLFEDYTSYSSADTVEWIRYFFNEDESLAGYERYVNNELNEIMQYGYIGSDYPDNAILHFEIPQGFTEEDIYIDWSQIYGDE